MRELLWNDAEDAEETLEWNETCTSCGGTGLHRGGQEGPGVAVVCHGCRGLGGHRRKAAGGRFTGLTPATGVERVFQCNPRTRLTTATPGGATMEAWENDPMAAAARGAEAREAFCPAWWYQTACADLKPEWPECDEARSFPQCRLFDRKAECWKRFDREQTVLEEEDGPRGFTAEQMLRARDECPPDTAAPGNPQDSGANDAT